MHPLFLSYPFMYPIYDLILHSYLSLQFPSCILDCLCIELFTVSNVISELCMFYSMCLELCCCWCFSVAKLCLTLSDSMDHSLPRSSVHGISQARIPEWGSISFSSWIFPTQGLNPCLLHWQADSLPLSHQGSPMHRISSTKSCLYNTLLHITNNLSS